MSVTEVIDKVKGALSGHDTLVARLEHLRKTQEVEGAARAAEITKAQAEVDKLEEPRRRLERLQAEDFAAGYKADAERAALENELRGAPPRELARFALLVERVYSRLRASDPPMMQEEVHRITNERRVVNVEEIERWRALAPLLVRLQIAICDELYKLPSTVLRERIAGLRREFEQAVAGTAFENEVG